MTSFFGGFPAFVYFEAISYHVSGIFKTLESPWNLSFSLDTLCPAVVYFVFSDI